MKKKMIGIRILVPVVLAMSAQATLAQVYFAGTTTGIGNTGKFVTGVGSAVLNAGNSGTGNSAFGCNAMKQNTGGSNNTAAGAFALLNNTTAGNNTAVGANAL